MPRGASSIWQMKLKKLLDLSQKYTHKPSPTEGLGAPIPPKVVLIVVQTLVLLQRPRDKMLFGLIEGPLFLAPRSSHHECSNASPIWFHHTILHHTYVVYACWTSFHTRGRMARANYWPETDKKASSEPFLNNSLLHGIYTPDSQTTRDPSAPMLIEHIGGGFDGHEKFWFNTIKKYFFVFLFSTPL